MILGLDNIVQNEDAIASLLTGDIEDSNLEDFNESEVQETSLEEETKQGEEIEETISNPEDFLIEDIDDKEEKNNDKTSSEEGDSDLNESPNVYSSLVKYLADSGTLTSLDEQSLKDIKSVEDLNEIINKEVSSRLDETTKGINKAIEANEEPQEVLSYRKSIDFLNKIDDSHITDESDRGVNVRQALIMQDYMNRGFSEERAQREVTKSFKAGTDIEDAKLALDSNKEFFSTKYTEYLDNLEKTKQENLEKAKQSRQKLIDSIKKEEKLLGSIKPSAAVRDKIIENMTSTRYVPEHGAYLTPIQEYQLKNGDDFYKNMSILYTLTDGFKSMDKLIDSMARKKSKGSIDELERVLNNSRRTSDGLLDFGPSKDEESNFRLDIDKRIY